MKIYNKITLGWNEATQHYDKVVYEDSFQYGGDVALANGGGEGCVGSGQGSYPGYRPCLDFSGDGNACNDYFNHCGPYNDQNGSCGEADFYIPCGVLSQLDCGGEGCSWNTGDDDGEGGGGGPGGCYDLDGIVPPLLTVQHVNIKVSMDTIAILILMSVWLIIALLIRIVHHLGLTSIVLMAGVRISNLVARIKQLTIMIPMQVLMMGVVCTHQSRMFHLK